MFAFERTARTWKRRAGSTYAAKSARSADLEDARAKLEAMRVAYRPKPVQVAPPRTKSRTTAVSEAKGAGSLTRVALVETARPKKVTHAQVRVAEEKLGTRFPAGYRTFVTTLGQGVLADLVRIHPPARIVRDRKKWRARVEQSWFWGAEPLARAHALEGFPLGDTVNGDQLAVLPDDPDAIWLLPRQSETSLVLGRGLAAALAHYVRSSRPSFRPF